MPGHNEKMQNWFLYGHIQKAYEYVNQFEDVSGRPLVVVDELDALYRQRMESVFRQHAREDMQVGRIDDIRIGPPRQSAGERAVCYREDTARIKALGVEAYATYLPIHYFHNKQRHDLDWGIVISEEGVAKLAGVLEEACAQRRAIFGEPQGDVATLFAQIAYQILLRHELVHYKLELWALQAELLLNKRLYTHYIETVYLKTYLTADSLEEALANKSVLDSRKIDGLFIKLYPTWQKGHTARELWNEVVTTVFFDQQPAGYRNYKLQDGHLIRQQQLAERADVVNYVCNQILTGDEMPHEQVPFYAFPPDNYFLRAESLVPIWVVPSLDGELSFLHVATPKKRDWIQFLRALGYTCDPADGKGDHCVWKQDGWPHITTNYHKNELDLKAFKQALHSLKINRSQWHAYHTDKVLPTHLSENRPGRDSR